MKTRLTTIVMGLLVWVSLAWPVQAFNMYWNHGGGNDLWSNPANWTSNSVPLTNDIINLANNCPDAPQTIVLDASATITNIVCTASGNRNYTINASNGATLTITKPANGIEGARGVDLTINADILSPVSGNFTVRRDGNNVTLNGNVTVNSSRSFFTMDAGTLILGGSNSALAVRNYGGGNIVSRHWHSLGDGYLQNYDTAGATLFLATNTSILSSAVTSLSADYPLNICITDAGTNDITLTVMGSCALDRITTLPGTNGSTGHLYIRSLYGSANTAEMTLDKDSSFVIANDSSIARIGNNAANAETGTISGAGSVIIESGAQVYVYATNDYTGGTIIRSGTVVLQGNDRLPTNGTVTVESAGTLNVFTKSQTVSNMTGNGTVLFSSTSVLGTNIITGLLAPGLAGVGTLTFGGSGRLILGPASTSVFELGPTNGPNDKVAVTSAAGHLTLDGALRFTNAGGLQPGTYTLFDLNGGTISGGFSSIIPAPGFSGTTNIVGGDVVLTVKAESKGTIFAIR